MFRIIWLFAVFLPTLSHASLAQQYDLVLRGGLVLDGSGNPAARADIAISDDEIVAVGNLVSVTARRVIDATGLYIAPGFIDMHSHADRSFVGDDIEMRRAPNLVAQGITTVVFGPDGRNPRWPLTEEIAAYESLGVALNVVPMVGHGTVRGLVMGDDYERHATAVEVEQMQALVRQGMESGAWGLGAGPEYRPGRFSATEEIIALAQVVAEYDGFYFAHQRSQSPLPRWQTPSILKDGWRLTGTDGMLETIRIGRESGIRVVGSHIKAKGPTTWGHSSVDIMLIEKARSEGVQVFLDQYPYETFGGGATAVIPLWAYAPPGTDRSGGLDDPRWNRDGLLDRYKENLRAHLSNDQTKTTLTRDMEHILDLQGGADRHIIVVSPQNQSLIGQSLSEVARANAVSPIDQLIHFALESEPTLRDGVRFRPVAGSQFDVENYMRQDYTATGTDAGVVLRGRPGLHPRYFGSYPHKLGHYVRDRGVMTLAAAIRSSTSLPALIIGLPDRGHIRVGHKADLVVFDFETVSGGSTILDPGKGPSGIVFVIANGEFTVDEGIPTGNLPGRVLDRRSLRGR